MLWRASCSRVHKEGDLIVADIAKPEHGLAVGAQAPDLTLPAIDGSTASFGALYREQPLLLTFYRGWW